MSDDERTQSPIATRVVATTLTDLYAGPSFHVEMVTQVTNGTRLDVLSEEGEWCRVRQADGYLGWAYRAYLADASPPVPTHLVADAELPLYREPRPFASQPVTRLPIGTGVTVVEQSGEWSRIGLAGDTLPGGWARLGRLRPLTSLRIPPDAARAQIVADAMRLSGVYYLWGGCTAWGIDCSGLTQLTHRLAGVSLLRDARLQFAQGRPVEPPFRPGDLLFFHGETDKSKITHVGISTGEGWRMIHSSRSRNGVYVDDLDAPHNANVRARFAGARTFLD